VTLDKLPNRFPFRQKKTSHPHLDVLIFEILQSTARQISPETTSMKESQEELTSMDKKIRKIVFRIDKLRFAPQIIVF